MVRRLIPSTTSASCSTASLPRPPPRASPRPPSRWRPSRRPGAAHPGRNRAGRCAGRGGGPAGCVVGSLAIGLVVGRATTPDPDERILEYLPVVEHLGVLQEAGSVAFLNSVAERAYPPPRRFPFGRPPEERPADGAARPDSPPAPPDEDDDWLQLNDTLEALQDGPFGPETPAGELDARRERVEDLDAEARRRLADAAAAFQELPLARRHDVIELARALGEGDPDGELGTLVGAARSWHRWLAWRDPADRHSIVALEAHERLEWLDRYARFNARPRFPQAPPGRGDAGEPPGRGWPGGVGFRRGSTGIDARQPQRCGTARGAGPRGDAPSAG
jgi:hypothetical protein